MFKMYQSWKSNCISIMHEGINSVLPSVIIPKHVTVENNTLTINKEKIPLHNNIHLVGFGKAVAGMANMIEKVLGDHLVHGIISIPKGTKSLYISSAASTDGSLSNKSKIVIFEGAENNLPDDNSHKSARAIADYASSLEEKDILIVLISGGGSSLLPLPIPPVTIKEKQDVTKKLSALGASIQELNTVRKRLSLIKGGGLSRMAKCRVISLILSDIIGDPLDLIASSPTVENTDAPELALQIIQKYNLEDKLPENVSKVLTQKIMQTYQLKTNTQNVIIGSNKIALKGCKERANSLGYFTETLSNEIKGESKLVGKGFADLADFLTDFSIQEANKEISEKKIQYFSNIFSASQDVINKVIIESCAALREGRSVCLLGGGETTVNIQGNGLGGRNQEMALSFSLSCKTSNAIFLSFGTDGIDGPTNAAGAFAYPGLVQEAKKQGLNPEIYLNNNDSFNFYRKFKDGNDHIVIGHTGTNVMDIQILLLAL